MSSARAKSTMARMTTSGTPAATPQPSHEMVHWEYDSSAEGQGFVSFAAVLIGLAAVLNTINGIAAIGKSKYFVRDANFVFGDLKTWGWVVLVLGIVQFFAVAAIWRGASW